MKVKRLIEILSKVADGEADVIIPSLSYLEGKKVLTPTGAKLSSDRTTLSIYTSHYGK